MAQVVQIMPFQSAVKQGRRIGVTDKAAVRDVLAAQRKGETGETVASTYRHIAWGLVMNGGRGGAA
ncbi:hypothetical protein CSC70_03925 [Pseudoxanthomonas kalamensis DSM 18571]|uniref:hypothetical protein n=1 Tax=Pseudoxanthomonas kalamensis TaxID=289483 RepID=UPI001391CA31|nr:hypothetical protein [Pseudoxanthomonas kalamensis]KAF1711084.1 hypothetical protein CSC70_03925 [Pseudoxanthomonas kalamensis DSM 18571]